MRKWLGMALAGLAALAWTGTARATNYALCTGLNKYSSAYMSGNDLTGCVPDAKNVYTNITLRGEWTSSNAKLFTNSQGTFAAVSNQLMNFASTAVSGDVVLYYHSSHGYQDSGTKTGICMYDNDMPDSSFAKILANFKAGVKVVIVLDTCHSGGMFKSHRRDGATELASPFAFAQRVNEELAAIRADEAARGIRTAAKLAIADCGWITAADYNQYSWDGDEGGAFTECFVGSVKSGACDKSPYGNGDSYATFKEMFDYAAAQDDTHGNGKPGTEDYTMPQCTNTTILAAVTFGWVGKEEPSGIRFAPIPEQTATVGAPISCTLVASNVDGSTGAITFSVASSTAPAGSYSLNGADFTFTAPADGSYSFDFLATNKTAKTFGKASMNVSATLAAPAGLDSTGITASSFTANWAATAGAASYLLDVSSSDFGAKAAPKADDALLSENFEAFSGTSADRSSSLDEYLVGTGWTGSKVFENAGSAKLGSSKATGWIATPELDLSSGGSVSFLLSQYNTDANTVTVSILAGGDETEIGSATPGSAETVEFAIPAASSATSVKIATSTKRAIIDDLVVTSGGGADVLANQPVEGTSYTVEGLETSTYYWRVRAVGNAKGPFSATEEVTLKSDPSAPPSIRKIDDIEIEVGETATAQVKVSAPDEAPVTSLTITAGDAAATLEEGVFSFAPAAPGTYEFTITAVNANGPAEVSFAVVATLAEPETPEQPTVVASDSFTAVWEAIPGAASYELDVIQGATSGGGGGGSGGSGETILTEDFSKVTTSNSTAISSFDDYTQIPGWSGSTVYPNLGMVKLGSSKAAGSLQTPALAVSGSVTVEWSAFGWSGDATTINVGVSEDGGSTFTETSVALTESMAVYTATFPVSGSSAIVRWQASAASKQRFFLDDISISSGAKARELDGNHVEGFPKNVGNVTSYDVTGLQSSTEYTFAFRAVAENGEMTDWSAPVTVKTDDGPSAPAWSAIPAQHAYVGATFQLDLSGYLSGSPTPAVTADVGSVSGLHFVYEPDATASVTVTLTAVNDSGTDTVSFSLAVDDPPVGGNHYAVIVGCNKYDSEYIDSGSWLNGCVPDANHVQALVTSRGQWDAANVAKLTDSAAKHSAVLSAIASAASKAVPGDTFLYFHSSHGGNYTYSFVTNTALYTDWPIMVYSVDPEGADNCVCTYDADFSAAELASALADFDPAVNIVVMIDACHSAGMFQYDDGTPVSQRAVRRNAAGKAMRPADPGLFAEAVGAQIGAIRRARGIRAAANVAFVTAANFDEYSFDSQNGDGGEFTSAFIEGVTNGLCDGADYGDQDGWATFYEGWNYAKDIATGMPEGTEVDYDGHAVDANGYALYDNSAYTGAPYYEPAYYYDYYFTHPQIDNESLLRVVRVGYAGTPTLAAPVAAEATDVTASGFTASWSAVADATGYRIQVATDPSFSTGGASDTLTVDDLAATGTSYTDFSGISKDSGAVYAGRSAKSSSGAIQLNSSQSAGIWTIASGGNVSRVAVVWNDATTSSKPRSLQIYGSDSALDSYSAVSGATSLGTIVYGTDTELAISGNYAYVGILPVGGALYLDSVTVEWGTAGSGSSIVLDDNVGNVTACDVSNLEPETAYWYRVQALGDPVDSDFSNVIGLTTEAGTPSAPVWSDIPPQTAVAGAALEVDLKPYVTGSPKPAITADAGTVENGVLTVSFAAAGDYTVTVTAENSEGSANATLAVTVTDAPVTVPVLTLSNPTASTFDADWTACTGAETYRFQVATAPEFKAVRAGDAILSEDFAKCDGSDTTGSEITSKLDDYTATAGWSGSKVFEGVGRLKLGTGKANGWVATPAVDIPAGAVLTCTIAQYGSDTGKVGINVSTDGGSTWAPLVDEFSPAAAGETVTVEFAQAYTGAMVQFISSAKRFYLDDVVLSGEGGGGGSGSTVILDTTTNGLSLTVTGLDPETTYYARVKGASDWSEVQSITTLSDTPAAPVWLDIEPQTATVGLEFGIDLSTYVIGSPIPAITVDGEPTDGGAWVRTFDEAGTYTFTLVAENSEGTATATLAVEVSEAPAVQYALCVGLSEYDMAAFAAMGLKVTPLKGCVNDATYLKASLTERGGWAEGNVALLTNGSATKDAIRGAIAAAVAKAKAGDTFIYEHSSHGLQAEEEDDYTAALATYNDLYTDTELAEDLAAFADGVKVVVLIDACHSAGMIDDGGDAGTSSKARPAAAFDISRRVSALIDANRAARKARGEDVARTLSSDQIGWVTAAAYDETSKDGGYYDTDKWMTDGEAEGEQRGGAFLASIAWGWWTGKADVSGEGDGDGWFDAYEGWSFSTPVCAEFDQTPQYLNADVLRSVELGWVGDAAPSADILFDDLPGTETAIGEEATLAVVAKNADGTTDGITLAIAATAPEGLDYTFADGTLAFTPAEDGPFLFTAQAQNATGASATKILGVTAVLPAPVAQEVEDADIAEDGFTARWLGVDAARKYQIQVSTNPDFPMGEPEELIEEGFDDVTDKASLPDGWEFTGTFGTYATGGKAAPSIKLSTDGATLTTPSFTLTGKEAGLSFWVKGNGSGTNMTSTLTVQQLVGEEWQTLKNGTFVPSTTGETKEFEELDANATRIRFVMAKTSGNIALDDVMVAQLVSPVVVDNDKIPADATSFAVEGLEPGTTYYFRVRALANTKSAWSEAIEVTTAGNKPLPVPDLTVMAPETSPDTSFAAFWVCTGAGEFRLQVATDETFATLVYDETMTQIAMTVTGLLPETTYYVRVCALDGDRAGDWSNVESITTASSGPVPPPSEAAITGMAIADGQMTITFAGEGAQILFSTDLVDWTPVEGATSPYTFDMGDGPGYIGVR